METMKMSKVLPIRTPFGHVWYVSTHKEDVPFEEFERRAAVLFGGAA